MISFVFFIRIYVVNDKNYILKFQLSAWLYKIIWAARPRRLGLLIYQVYLVT